MGFSGRLVTEAEFMKALTFKLSSLVTSYDYVTGPGRSGAVAAVYASHFLGIPFAPYKCFATGRPLIIDTAAQSGRTIRKASRLYANADWIVIFHEPPRVRFWYEELSRVRGRGREYNTQKEY